MYCCERDGLERYGKWPASVQVREISQLWHAQTALRHPEQAQQVDSYAAYLAAFHSLTHVHFEPLISIYPDRDLCRDSFESSQCKPDDFLSC